MSMQLYRRMWSVLDTFGLAGSQGGDSALRDVKWKLNFHRDSGQ